jgi:DNA-binding MarR family transcriptional regulator
MLITRYVEARDVHDDLKKQVVKAYGLEPRLVLILHYLSVRPFTLTELSSYLNDYRSTTSVRATLLEAAGLIKRSHPFDDQRLVSLTITRAGRKLLNAKQAR